MEPLGYFQVNPPRCLAGFHAQSTLLPVQECSDHRSASDTGARVRPVTGSDTDDLHPVFALSCRCGGDRHLIRGYWVNSDYASVGMVFVGPLALECAACGKRTDLLDTDLHGYDAELGSGSCTKRGEGESVVYECPDCGPEAFQAFVQFEYPDDLFEDESPEFAGREHDLFSWFYLVGRCGKCSQVLLVTDFECA